VAAIGHIAASGLSKQQSRPIVLDSNEMLREVGIHHMGVKLVRPSPGPADPGPSLPKDTTMSTSEAERYGRRAGHSTDVKELADNVWRAVDALSKAIKDLETKVRRLEARG
jgi:hypothetical protein